jgi:hypothetical protein
MKHQLSKIKPIDTLRALREAEAELERPESTGAPVFIHVAPQEILERLELFQPRRPGWGTRTLETSHVNSLKARIVRKGELDPPLVVRLAGKWTVVDGHHRLAAYAKAKHTAPIKCEWFAGTVREAMDASLSRNEKTHLRVDQGDKWEASWLRTQLDWDGDDGWTSSKQQVVTLTGSGEGTVAAQRRAFKQHHNYSRHGEHHPVGEKLHDTLGPDLRIHTWNRVNRVLLDLSPKEFNASEAAAKLSGQLTRRMTNKLSEDPEVTAQALWLYDREAYPKLLEAMQHHLRSQQEAERAEADQGAYGSLEDDD